MSSTTFKVTAQQGEPGESIRRFRLPNPVTFEALRNKAQPLFALEENVPWFFKYLDEDGDLVTITEECELSELMEEVHASGTNVVRLTIHVSKPKTSSPPPPVPQIPTPESLAEFAEGAASWLGNHLLFPDQSTNACDAWKAQVEKKRQKLERKVEQKVQKLERKASQKVQKSERKAEKKAQKSERKAEKKAHKSPTKARCDVSNAPLGIGEGWYHKRGTCYDLCELEWRKLSPLEQASFVLVTSPACLGGQEPVYFPEPFVTRPAMAWCDHTNKPLFPGQGWYHKPGFNYDVCEEIYQKASDKGGLVRVDKPEDLGDDLHRYALGTLPCTSALHAATASDPESEEATQLSVEIVSAPSIPPTVVGGSRVAAVWEVKNTSQKTWEGVRIKPRHPETFADHIPREGFEAPILLPGANGVISLDLSVPRNCVGKAFTAEFDFVDSNGVVFSVSPLALTVTVENEVTECVSGEDELVAQLANMGFTDERACLRALRHNKGDVNNAALALLRTSFQA